MLGLNHSHAPANREQAIQQAQKEIAFRSDKNSEEFKNRPGAQSEKLLMLGRNPKRKSYQR